MVLQYSMIAAEDKRQDQMQNRQHVNLVFVWNLRAKRCVKFKRFIEIVFAMVSLESDPGKQNATTLWSAVKLKRKVCIQLAVTPNVDS